MPQKQVINVSLVLKYSDMELENLSSLIRLSVSDGQKTDSSKDVSCIHTGKCKRRFGGVYAYCRYFIDRKW